MAAGGGNTGLRATGLLLSPMRGELARGRKGSGSRRPWLGRGKRRQLRRRQQRHTQQRRKHRKQRASEQGLPSTAKHPLPSSPPFSFFLLFFLPTKRTGGLPIETCPRFFWPLRGSLTGGELKKDCHLRGELPRKWHTPRLSDQLNARPSNQQLRRERS